MPSTVVVGSQWGDEGKGKIVDAMSEQADMVVRFQGGANAGHTLVVNGQKTVLHLIPSGILHPSTICLIGPAVVIDVEKVIEEIEALQLNGHLQNTDQLKISKNATVLWPFHQALDKAREIALGTAKRGTTGRGIGPAYEDRAARIAVTIGDIFHEDTLKTKLQFCLNEKNAILKNYDAEEIKIDDMLAWIDKFRKKIRPFIETDCSSLIAQALKENKRVLFEGAQGALLDVYHGTYPFVTSSSTIAGSSCTGSGIGPVQINKVIGITKAYCTRVGTGPFPTELFDESGKHMADNGHEFGSTTGRPRRCGWLDLVALKYSAQINGLTSIALMKMDVLTGLDEIRVCTGYKVGDKKFDNFGKVNGHLADIVPEYEVFEGWSENIDSVKKIEDLPESAQKYVSAIAEKLGIPVDILSVGPGRDQTIWLEPAF